MRILAIAFLLIFGLSAAEAANCKRNGSAVTCDDGRTGIGPGTPFTETHLPSRSPGYYLGATYTTPGTKHVTLTVTWRVTFRLEGVTDIPLTPITMTATEDKQVATARAVLVN